MACTAHVSNVESVKEKRRSFADVEQDFKSRRIGKRSFGRGLILTPSPSLARLGLPLRRVSDRQRYCAELALSLAIAGDARDL